MNQTEFAALVRGFFRHLWREGAYSHYWTPGRGKTASRSYWFSLTERLPRSPHGRICKYFGVHPVREIPPTNARGKPRKPPYVRSQIQYIAAVNTLFGEFDVKDYGSSQAICQHIEQLPQPSVIVFSGGGYHCYWLLSTPFVISSEADREHIRRVQYNWVQFVGGDPGAKDLARVLRIPGSRNYKPVYAPHFPLVNFVRADLSVQYTLSELEQLSEPLEELAEVEEVSRPVISGDIPQDYRERALNIAAQMIRQAPDGQKHFTLLRAARLMGGYIAGGIVAEHEATDLLQREIAAKPNVRSLKQAYRTIQDGIAYGRQTPITVEDIRTENTHPK